MTMGASGATRPRDLFLGRNLTMGGILAPGVVAVAAQAYRLRQGRAEGDDVGLRVLVGQRQAMGVADGPTEVHKITLADLTGIVDDLERAGARAAASGVNICVSTPGGMVREGRSP